MLSIISCQMSNTSENFLISPQTKVSQIHVQFLKYWSLKYVCHWTKYNAGYTCLIHIFEFTIIINQVQFGTSSRSCLLIQCAGLRMNTRTLSGDHKSLKLRLSHTNLIIWTAQIHWIHILLYIKRRHIYQGAGKLPAAVIRAQNAGTFLVR